MLPETVIGIGRSSEVFGWFDQQLVFLKNLKQMIPADLDPSLNQHSMQFSTTNSWLTSSDQPRFEHYLIIFHKSFCLLFLSFIKSLPR
jgi:hypothetical protein